MSDLLNLPADLLAKLPASEIAKLEHYVTTYDDRVKHEKLILSTFEDLASAMAAVHEAEKALGEATEAYVEAGGAITDVEPYEAYRVASGKSAGNRGRTTSWRTVAGWYAEGKPEIKAPEEKPAKSNGKAAK